MLFCLFLAGVLRIAGILWFVGKCVLCGYVLLFLFYISLLCSCCLVSFVGLYPIILSSDCCVTCVRKDPIDGSFSLTILVVYLSCDFINVRGVGEYFATLQFRHLHYKLAKVFKLFQK